MYIYILVFFVSCLLLYFSEKKKKKKISKFLSCIAILSPCVLAGLRAYNIGTDVQIYGLPIYKCAENSISFDDFFNKFVRTAKCVHDYELGFILIEYVGYKLFNSFQVVLFFIQLLIMLPIYYGVKINKDLSGKKWFVFLVFYLMFYNTGLNLMRQYIGLSFLFLGINILLYSEKNNNRNFFICLIVACFFHKSSILGIFIFIICKMLNSKNSRKLIISNNLKLSVKKIRIVIVILCGFGLLFGADYIVRILNKIGLSYYSQYIDGELTSAKSLLLRNLPMIIAFAILYKNVIKKYKNSYFFIVCFILNLIVLQLSSINIHAARIALFFSIFNIEFFCMLANCIDDKNMEIFIKIGIIIYLLYYWYYSFVYLGGSETIPYRLYS